MFPLLRFTLDLFDSAGPTAAVEPASVLPVARADFAHPRANREVLLGHTRVAYEFKRGQRRSIGFSVGVDGLAVRAPKWVTLRDVDAALQTKAPWILRKLQDSRERQARMADQVILWQDGASLPFLGQTLTLQLDPGHRFGTGGAQLAPATEADGGPILWVSLAGNATPEQIRDAVQAWLMRQAKRIFQERLDHFAPQLGVQWRKLALSNAGTRWGSARRDGAIRLNWRLVHFRMSVLDYVVVHELSHLRVMDHSPRFWDTVRTVVPDYAEQRAQLKNAALPKWA
jgi:predicted metal-dependent hydrolase